MTLPTFQDLNEALIPLSIQAGNKILEFYHSNFQVEEKADTSPVTEADKAAELIILEELSKLWPSIPVVAEELSAQGQIIDGGSLFFLVDPLDGTKEFISKRNEFTVNIALIQDGVPVYGVIFAPALGELYVSLSQTQAGMIKLTPPFDVKDIARLFKTGALRLRDISVRDWPGLNEGPEDGAIAVVSRSHIDQETHDFLDKNKITERAASGSSLKFCLLARGDADLYPRFGPTMEWDTAAGHGILLAAGGCVIDEQGDPFGYGKFNKDYRNGSFIACGARSLPFITT